MKRSLIRNEKNMWKKLNSRLICIFIGFFGSGIKHEEENFIITIWVVPDWLWAGLGLIPHQSISWNWWQNLFPFLWLLYSGPISSNILTERHHLTLQGTSKSLIFTTNCPESEVPQCTKICCKIWFDINVFALHKIYQFINLPWLIFIWAYAECTIVQCFSPLFF